MYRPLLTYSGPQTHDFVEEAQAVAIVMQEQEDAKKKPRGVQGPDVVKVDTVDLPDN